MLPVQFYLSARKYETSSRVSTTWIQILAPLGIFSLFVLFLILSLQI